MTDPTPNSTLPSDSLSESQSAATLPGPLRCFGGAIVAGAIAFALYLLTSSIAQTFANKPLPSGNATAINIAIAVRTLVVGMSALGTGIFGLAALGLAALGVQILVKRLTKQ